MGPNCYIPKLNDCLIKMSWKNGQMVTRSVRESESHFLRRSTFLMLKGKILKILSRNQVLTPIKSPNSVTNKQIMEGSNSKLDLVNINAFTKFGKILSIPSLEIERKCKFGLNLVQ